MTIMKRYLFIAALLGSTIGASAQDYHLSQYDMAPMYLNPALTGMRFFGERMPFRISANYRSQWQKLQGKPYSSVAIGFDMPKDEWGFGVQIMDHIAGAANFGTFQFLASGAYRITDANSKNHFLSTGLQMGLFQKRFNPGNLIYENQYTDQGFDEGLPSGESYGRESIFRFDANMGIFYKYTDPNKRFDPSAGFAIYHITTPNESFTGQKHRLPMRFNGHVACDIHIDEQFTLTPNGLFMYQRKAMEINAGLMAGYNFKDSPYNLLAGGSYRHKDAIVIHLGLKQGTNMFRLSYDIVTSYLKNFGGSRSGFEMGMIYTGGNSNPNRSSSTVPGNSF